VPDILDAVSEEFAFLQLESHTVLHKNIANTFEKTTKSSKNSSPQEDVIDDDTTAKVSSVGRIARLVTGVPFTLEDAHHTGVKSRGIARPKRHHGPTIFVVVRGKESKLLLVLTADANLVIASFIVKGDKKQMARRVAEVIDGVVTTRMCSW
jgi:hypothetical protein